MKLPAEKLGCCKLKMAEIAPARPEQMISQALYTPQVRCSPLLL